MDKKGLKKYWGIELGILLIVILILISVIGSVDVVIQDCVAQESAASSGTWGTSCDDSYPGNTLFFDDSNYEVHQVSKSGPGFWAGLKINSSDTSISDCESITNVDFCYKWWSATPYVISCDISVDADDGASYTAVTTTCPTASEPGSVTCTDVTSLESWSCDDFFNGEGALAKSELVHSGAGANGNFDVTWDVFSFNVSYSNVSCNESLANTSWSSWVNESCVSDNMNQSRFLTQYDLNNCGVANQTIYDSQLVGPTLVNTSWGSWINISCLADDTMNQSRTKVEFDIYSCASNTTFTEYQNILFCDYCTPSLVNTSWTGWDNISSCYINNTIDQERNLTQYDSNVCGEVSNQTFFEYQIGNCSYPDTIAPVITTVTSEYVTNNSASIEWSTNEGSNSSVDYGFGLTAGQNDNVEDHSVGLSNLENSTTYYYNVTSCDIYNNCNTSANYNFTTEEIEVEVEVNESMEDSQGNPMNITFEIFDENNSLLYNETATSHSQGLAKGHYKIKIYPKNHPIKKIEFRDLYIDENLNGLLDIEDPGNGPWHELYAINPVANFTNMTFVVTSTASVGSSIIYKCLLWNFTESVCEGDWVPFIDVIPGQEYNLTLDFVDPGLAEGNGTFFESFESGSFDTYNWTTYGAGSPWTVSTDDAYAGAYHAKASATGAGLNSYLEVNVSTVGYEDVNISYYRRLVGLDGVDNFAVEWYNGTNWSTLEELGGDSANEPNYTIREYQLSSFADDNPNLKFRFMCENGAVSEHCRVDNVLVNGSIIVPDTSNPVINSVIDSPDPVVNGTEIIITVNITDDSSVDSSWVKINGANYTMNQLSASAGFHEDILFDDFESGSLSFHSWSLSGTGEYWVGSSLDASTGNYHAQAHATGVGAPSSMEVSKSTSGYTNISVSYERKLISLDVADDFSVEFYNGTEWEVLEELGSGTEDNSNYVSRNFTLNESANDNSNFKLRFMCEVGAVSEYCRVDNVNISGALSSSPTDDWQYEYLTNSLGDFNYSVYSNDTSGNNAISVSGNFSVIESNVSIVESVRDSNGTAINTSIEIIDETNTIVYNETKVSHYKQVGKGRYKIKIRPKNHKVRKIEFEGINLTNDLSEIVDIDDPGNESGFNEVFAVNPLAGNATNNDTFIVSAIASANSKILYKCANWSFNNQTCEGNWVEWMAIVPGQEYNASFIVEDPGLAEGNGTFFEGFESGSLDTNNWTTSGGGTSNWFIYNAKSKAYAGVYDIEASDTDGESVLVTNISASEYGGVVFSFYAKTEGLDSGEYVAADWYNGSEWKNVLAQTQVISEYTLYNYSLDSTADNNPDLKIRFRCSNDASNEYCFVDNIRIDGISISGTSGPIINLYNPEAITYSSNISLPLNFSVSDSNGVDSCWYNLDNGINQSLVSCQNTTFDVSGEGNYALYIFSNDSLGNEENSSVSFNVDLTGISLTIYEPRGAKTSRIGIPISYNATGNNLSCWYNVKTSIGGDVIANTNLVNCSGSSFEVSNDGDYIFRLYANNSLGSLNSANSSFSVSTSSGEIIDGGGSGGGSGTTIVSSGTSAQLELGKLKKLIVEPGDVKEIIWNVENTGTRFLNDCKIKEVGNYSSWVSSAELKNLAAGEEYKFNFDLYIPLDAAFGEYDLEIVLECGEFSDSSNLILEILEKKLGFDLINFEKFSEDSVKIIYSLEELSGVEQNVEVQFLLFKSDGEKIADVEDIKYLGANSKKEFEIMILADSHIEGDLNLLINLNSEIYSGFIQEDIFLGHSITGFALFGEEANMDNIFTGVLVVGFLGFAFFMSKRIFSHKKKPKKKGSENGVPGSLIRKVERQKRKISGNKKGFFKGLFSGSLYKKDTRGVVLVDNKIIGILGKAAEGKDCNGKYIHLKVGSKKVNKR